MYVFEVFIRGFEKGSEEHFLGLLDDVRCWGSKGCSLLMVDLKP